MKNVGSLDRIVRLVLGSVFVGAAATLQLSIGRFWWLALPGAVFLATAAMSTCPLYLPFRLSTIKKDN